MESQKKIYNRIKANLALHQVKNKELAEQLQVSDQTVSKWCTNHSQPSVPQLYEIAMFLQVPVPELLEPIKLR
jgi:putative transcriptional regulator